MIPTIADNSSYVYNLWELVSLGFWPNAQKYAEDYAEEQFMRFPAFSGDKPPGNGTPATYRESAQRPIYTALNLLHLDIGNFESWNNWEHTTD